MLGLSLLQTGKRRAYMDDNPVPMLTSIGALRGSITVSTAIGCATACARRLAPKVGSKKSSTFIDAFRLPDYCAIRTAQDGLIER